MELIKIVFGLLYAIFLFWNVSTDNKDNRVFSAFLLTISAIILAVLILYDDNKNIPTALDVYQGKTTIKYEVVDGVKVDSVVIFKNDDYGKN